MLEINLMIVLGGLISSLLGKSIFWYIKRYQLSDMTHIDAWLFYWKALGNFYYLIAIGAVVSLIVVWFDYLFL